MKATVHGIELEGTAEEIAQVIQILRGVPEEESASSSDYVNITRKEYDELLSQVREKAKQEAYKRTHDQYVPYTNPYVPYGPPNWSPLWPNITCGSDSTLAITDWKNCVSWN